MRELSINDDTQREYFVGHKDENDKTPNAILHIFDENDLLVAEGTKKELEKDYTFFGMREDETR